MSNIVAGNRNRIDRYASAKTVGEFLLTGGLIADDIRVLYDTTELGDRSEKYYYALIAVLAISLVLQVIAVIMAMVLMLRRLPGGGQQFAGGTRLSMSEGIGTTSVASLDSDWDAPPSMRRVNDGLTIIAMLIAILHIVRSVLGGNVGSSWGPTMRDP